MKKLVLVLVALAAVLVMGGAPARAEEGKAVTPPAETVQKEAEKPVPETRFDVKAGVWNVTPRGSISVSGPAVNAYINSLPPGLITGPIKTSVDFVSDLGFKGTTPLFLGAEWRFFRNTSVYAEYYNLNQEQSFRLPQAVTIPVNYNGYNTTFAVSAGSGIDTKLKLSFLDLGVEQSILRTASTDINVILDAKIANVEAGFTASGYYKDSGGTYIPASFSQGLPSTFPKNIIIPGIGLSGNFRAKAFDAGFYYKFFTSDSGGSKVDVADYGVTARFNFKRHWGVGLEYKYFRVFARGTYKDSYTGLDVNPELLLEHSGPLLRVEYRF